MSALRKGPKHADTQTLKKSATDLVWAASAKPNRADRARVIQDLPNLLVRLRSGMTLLGMPPSEQEANVKKISDTLADAFLSKTQAIPQAKIDAMAQRLVARGMHVAALTPSHFAEWLAEASKGTGDGKTLVIKPLTLSEFVRDIESPHL